MIRQHRPLVQIILLGILLSSPGEGVFALPPSGTILYQNTEGFDGSPNQDSSIWVPVVSGIVDNIDVLGYKANNGSVGFTLELWEEGIFVKDLDCQTATRNVDEWGFVSQFPRTDLEPINNIGPFTGTECGVTQGVEYRVVAIQDAIGGFHQKDSPPRTWMRVFGVATPPHPRQRFLWF